MIKMHAVLQNIWSEECLISWLNQLAKSKVIPDYPAMKKGSAVSGMREE